MKILLQILFLFISLNTFGQKLAFRINFNAAQFLQWKNTETINLDTNLYDGYRYYIEDFKPYQKVYPEIPGLSMEYRGKNNCYYHSGINFTIDNFWDNPNSDDSLKQSLMFKFFRYSFFAEGGYYFRQNKLLKPYLSAGFSLTKLQARLEDYNSDYIAYENYFNNTPVFLSATLKAGIKHGGVGFGLSYSISVTPTSTDGKMGTYKNFTALSFSWDILRSVRMKKTQYKTKLETDDIKIVRSQVLKQSETSWSLGMPYYRFVSSTYLNAYSEGSINYRIETGTRPISVWVPYINLNTVNALNTKRTFYVQTNLGYSNVRLNYKHGKTYSYPSGNYLNSGAEIYKSEISDLKIVYHSFWMGAGNGYKIKTTRRSFIYLDYDLRINYFKRIKDAELYIPPVKKLFLSASIEGGLKFNHFGIALSLERNISRLDKYQFYDRMFNLSLKLIYDVSSR